MEQVKASKPDLIVIAGYSANWAKKVAKIAPAVVVGREASKDSHSYYRDLLKLMKITKNLSG